MNNIIKYGAIAVGAYLLYENFIAPKTIVNTNSVGSNGQTSTVTGSSPNPVNNTSANITTRDAMIKAIAKLGRQDGTLNIDEWNYIYNQVTGKTPPAPEDWGFMGDTRATKIWLDNYLPIAAKGGFSGISGFGMLAGGERYHNFGLGMVAPTGQIGYFPEMGSAIERANKRVF